MTNPAPEPPARVVPHLTDREIQILTAMSYGKRNSEIARVLFISVDTVKTHAHRLYRRLEVRDRAHAVRVALELGILTTTAKLRAPTPPLRSHPDAVPGQPIPAPGLRQPTPRDPMFKDRHIAACIVAEQCPCRRQARRSA